MQTSAEAVYSASSPPFIIDSDMSGRLDSGPDFEFFDSNNLSLDSANSPSIFLAEEYTDGSQFLNFSSPPPSTYKSPLQGKASPIDTKVQQHPPLSAPSTASPTGSCPDTSSESSEYKRKSSSESSRSALSTGDVMMADDADMGDWKTEDMIATNDAAGFGTFDGTINPASMNTNFEFNDKSMENDFDFESAASSPSPFAIGPVDMGSPDMPTIKYNAPRKRSPAVKNKFHRNHNKASSVSFDASNFLHTLIISSNIR
jgi:hypothetical protein